MKPIKIKLLQGKSVDWEFLYNNSKFRIVLVDITKETVDKWYSLIDIALHFDTSIAGNMLRLVSGEQFTKNIAELVGVPRFTFVPYNDIMIMNEDYNIMRLHFFEGSDGFEKLNLLTDLYWLWINDKHE